MSKTSYDVIVAGGGPAGATAATLVAQRGHRVLLVERSTEPQFKIGESLMPASYWTFERLGVLDRMKASPFTKKYSIQFFTPDGRATKPFFFRETRDHESSQTWQVLRSEFDQMLLDNAAEKGVEVRRGVTVRDVLFEGERAVGVRIATDGGPAEDLAARVVVDASGQSALLARKLKLRVYDDRLQNAAVFTHYRGGLRDPGEHAGATLVYRTRNRDSWFWYIPLHDDVVSVGVVGRVDYLVRGRDGSPEEIFDQELALCPRLAERLVDAERIRPMHVLRDFTYRAERFGGDGWVTVGDAFGFIDPIYSSGVFLALKSGEFAADSINEGLEIGDLSAAQLSKHGQEYLDGIEAIRKLVYAFYDREFSFGRFLTRHPECRLAIVHLLTGNVYREPIDHLFARLAESCELPADRPTLLD
jgi:flavin-dependent dehydrogenase